MAIQQADLASALAEISKLSNDELKELCNSESNDKYDEFVNKSEKVKSLEAERGNVDGLGEKFSEFNLARQNSYESDRSQLLTAVGDSNKLKEQIQEKATKLLELSRKTSLDSTLAVVLAATAQSEEDSESVAHSFLNNTLDYDSSLVIIQTRENWPTLGESKPIDCGKRPTNRGQASELNRLVVE